MKNKKFIKQAKLPKGAYPVSFKGLEYYAKQAQKKKLEKRDFLPGEIQGKDKNGEFIKTL